MSGRDQLESAEAAEPGATLQTALRLLLFSAVLERATLKCASARIERRAEVGDEELAAVASAGPRDRPSPASDAKFDLASITKPFVATLALVLDRLGNWPLATRLGDLEPELPEAAARRTLGSLLCHRSGLRPWAPFYRLGARRPGERIALLCERRWWDAPADTYSDLGYVLWAALLERVEERTLEQLLQRHVLRPLGLGAEIEAQGAVRGAVRCELDTDKEVELGRGLGMNVPRLGPPETGEAQDGNARYLGGVPGHAGLFGSVAGVAGLLREWVVPGGVLERSAVESATTGNGRFAFCWRRSEAQAGGAALLVHDGFVGGTVWLDLENASFGVLLGYRRQPHVDLSELRRSFRSLH